MRNPEGELTGQWTRATDYLRAAEPRSSQNPADALRDRNSQEAFERAERELIGDDC